jgi:hypothetical protein
MCAVDSVGRLHLIDILINDTAKAAWLAQRGG